MNELLDREDVNSNIYQVLNYINTIYLTEKLNNNKVELEYQLDFMFPKQNREIDLTIKNYKSLYYLEFKIIEKSKDDILIDIHLRFSPDALGVFYKNLYLMGYQDHIILNYAISYLKKKAEYHVSQISNIDNFKDAIKRLDNHTFSEIPDLFLN